MLMPRLIFSERFADDFASIFSDRLADRIMTALDNVELNAGFGSRLLPRSVRDTFEGDVRKVAVNPFDLIYTYYKQDDLVVVEALIHQRRIR